MSESAPAEAPKVDIDAGAMRRALLRGVLIAAVGVLGAAPYFLYLGGELDAYGLVIGSSGGLVVVPVTLVEFLTERWPRTGRRALGLCALVWVIATLSTYLGYVQAYYTATILVGRGAEEGLSYVTWIFRRTLEEPQMFVVLFSAVAVAFASTALFRRRDWHLALQVVGALAAVALISAPLLLLTGFVGQSDAWFALFMTFLGALALPLVYAGADRLERRLWLVDPPPEDPEPA